jgi:hypothetical protein
VHGHDDGHAAAAVAPTPARRHRLGEVRGHQRAGQRPVGRRPAHGLAAPPAPHGGGLGRGEAHEAERGPAEQHRAAAAHERIQDHPKAPAAPRRRRLEHVHRDPSSGAASSRIATAHRTLGGFPARRATARRSPGMTKALGMDARRS